VPVAEERAQVAQDLPVQPQRAGPVAVAAQPFLEALPEGRPVLGFPGDYGRVALANPETSDFSMGRWDHAT